MTRPLPLHALIVIPAFDEEANVAPTIAELRNRVPDADVVVVDDGSRDRTAAAARAAGAGVLSHAVNLGAGGSVQTAFRYALARGYEAVVQHDADGQHDPAFIPALLAPLAAGEADVAVGSRYLTPGGFRASALRAAGIRLFSVVTSVLAGQRVTDVTSGQRAFNRRAMALLAQNFPTEYPDAEAILAMTRAGLRLREVAVTMRPRRFGASKTTPLRALSYPAKALVAVLVEALRAKYR